jgi:hypothetical protein
MCDSNKGSQPQAILKTCENELVHFADDRLRLEHLQRRNKI